MRAELHKRNRKIGLPPGSLIYTGERKSEKAHLELTIYNAEQYQHTANANIDQCLLSPSEKQLIWINVSGLHNVDLIAQLNQHFNIHPLVTEDILNTGQRAKADDYENYLFLTLKALNWDEKAKNFNTEQVSIVFGQGFLLSFQEQPTLLFTRIQERLSYAQGRLRDNKSDYLAYALIDIIVDQYFLVLEQLGEVIEKTENEIITNPTPKNAHDLYRLKQQMYGFRKSVWPLREVINHLLRNDGKLVSHTTAVYLRDVYDHIIQAIDTIEAFHDRLDSMLDVHLSSLTNRMNEIMKVLTIIATIFIPLTFIASIYGMNFEYMPELHWRMGYPVTLMIMGFIAAIMIVYFKSKKWW